MLVDDSEVVLPATTAKKKAERARSRREGVVLVLFAATVPLSALGAGTIAAHLACRAHGACAEAARLPLSDLTCTSGTDPDVAPATVGAARACAFVACPSRVASTHILLGGQTLGASMANVHAANVHAAEALTSPQAAMVAQWRGDCPYGMRTVEGATRCVMQWAWPWGVVVDAMDPDATSVSRRACGRWMDTFDGPANVEFSFMDVDRTTEDLWLLTEAVIDVSNAHVPGRATKIVAECRATLAAGERSVRLGATAAYRVLEKAIGAPQTVHDVARGLGELAARRCPGPVRLSFRSDEQGFLSTIVDGVMPAAGQVDAAMAELGLDAAYVAEATQALAAVAAGACGVDADEVPHAAIEAVLGGIVGDTTSLGPTPDAERRALGYLRSTLCMLGASHGPLAAEARARALWMLRGLAAECVDIVVDRMRGEGGEGGEDGEDGEDGARRLRASGARRHRRHRRGPSLGRVSAWGRPDTSLATALSIPTEEEWTAVSTGVLARLVDDDDEAAGQVREDDPPAGPPADGCFDTLQYAAITIVEDALFFVVVPPSLYARLELVVAAVRDAVATVVVENPIVASLFANPGAVAASVLNTRVRISGAPPGTWAGRTFLREHGAPDHGNGVFSSVLEHVRDETRDWVSVIFAELGQTCDARPIREASEPNGYYLYPHECVVLMLGLLHMPLADEAYDDETILSRIGFVIAHELAHASIPHARLADGYGHVLEHYASSQREEALADVVAMVALEYLRPGRCEDMLLHVGQIFCRSEGATGAPPISTSGLHPSGNSRGNALAWTLYDKFGLVCGGWA